MNSLKLSLALLAFCPTALSSCKQNESHPEHTTQHAATPAYACPMHPEVIGKNGDACSKCGMKLEKIISEKITMTVTAVPENIEAGKPAQLTLTPHSEKGIVTLEETHERKLHLIAVTEDLSWFDHIHPQPTPGGAYTIRETFPAGGDYLLYADYKPQDGSAQTDRLELHVHGEQTPGITHPLKNISETDGYTVTVENSHSLFSGSVAMPVVIRKEGNVLKRSDLETYLGAPAHIILIGVKDKDFLHVHPGSTEAHAVYAHANIMKAGLYRMWVQFQTNGIVHTADFTLDVKSAGEQGHSTPEHKH